MKKYIMNMKMSKKFAFLSSSIISLFTVLTILVLLAFAYIYSIDYKFNNAFGRTMSSDFEVANQIRNIESNFNSALYFLYLEDDEKVDEKIEKIYENFEIAKTELGKIHSNVSKYFDEESDVVKNIKDIEYSLITIETEAELLIDAIEKNDKRKIEKIYREKAYLVEEALEKVTVRRNSTLNGISNFTKNLNFILKITIASVAILYIITTLVASLFTRGTCRMIKSNIQQLIKNVGYIKTGQLENVVALNQKDEIGDLSRDIAIASETVLNLVEDLNNSTTSFIEKGIIHSEVDAEKYQGTYKEVANELNRVYEEINFATEEVLGVLTKMVDGDFEFEIREYPGEKIIVNQIIDGVAGKIRLISSEIRSIIESNSRGEIGAKVDTTNFEGEWKEILNGLNLVSEGIAKPFEEFKEVLGEVGKGNLQVEVQGDYVGGFKEISDIINHTINELSEYISEISKSLNAISRDRDLTMPIEQEFLGEFNQIKVAINNIIETSNTMFSDFLATANELTDVSLSLTDGSVTVATGASEQVTTLNELNNSVDFISKNTKENADSSQKANEISATSRENAINGDQEMQTMLSAMEEIKNASSDIANIIKVIDDIAFQTNLLALNAAVEAAHAGQHGRGFAVVAEEVGNLASRSKVAAEQTSALIKRSLEKVELGSQLANSTASTLNKILGNVTEVSTLLEDISSASTTQASSLAEVSNSLKSFESIVQTYTATSEQSVATSEELSAQAEELRSALSSYRLN